VTELAKIGVYAAIGGVATRSLTQLALQDKNQGLMGYGANIIASLGLAYLAGKFAGKEAAVGVAAGGFSATIMRIWSEKVSGSSVAALTGLGDLDFSSNGLGAYVDSGFPVPTHSQVRGNYLYADTSSQVANPGAASGGSMAPMLAVQPAQDGGIARHAARY
ncbi:MAG: hypothetical protein ACREMY_20345, partial [bacterium]